MSGTAFARRSIFHSVVLVVAILAFVWHIVPLASSVHNPFTTPSESHGPFETGAEASHVSSCDAMTSRTAPSFAVPGLAIPVAIQLLSSVPCAPPRAILPVAARSSPHHSGAPLFLLHASFLI